MATRPPRPIYVVVDGLTTPLSRGKVRRVVETVLRAERVKRALISITFLSNRDIAAMNRKHLGVSGTTDVISFGFRRRSSADPVLGDVYIAPGVAKENAAAAGVRLPEELVRLVVHGTLHVLGHDHPEGSGRESSPMWKRQERLVSRALAMARSR